MSLGIRDAERKKIVLHRVIYWVAGIMSTPLVFVFLLLFPPTIDSSAWLQWIEIRNAILSILVLMSTIWAILMFPIVFFEWFPESYYNDLEQCPSCNEKSLKVVSEAKCFECGLVSKLAHSGVSARADREPPNPRDNM